MGRGIACPSVAGHDEQEEEHRELFVGQTVLAAAGAGEDAHDVTAGIARLSSSSS